MLEDFSAYKKSNQIWNLTWNDTEIMKNDFRGKEICRQLIRSVGSISANIEEGYGRGSNKEYPNFLKISRGSATESKGWFKKSKFLLDEKIINERVLLLKEIIAMLTKTIITLEKKAKEK
jgi:four helix bundle protein